MAFSVALLKKKLEFSAEGRLNTGKRNRMGPFQAEKTGYAKTQTHEKATCVEKTAGSFLRLDIEAMNQIHNP